MQCTCHTCGSSFERIQSHTGFATTKSGLYFCSRACKDTAQQIGGDIQLDRYTDGKHRYRKRALRDNGRVCEDCGYDEDDQMLDVHHEDGDRGNNKISNLKVVCVWCHALITRKVEVHAWNGSVRQRETVSPAS